MTLRAALAETLQVEELAQVRSPNAKTRERIQLTLPPFPRPDMFKCVFEEEYERREVCCGATEAAKCDWAEVGEWGKAGHGGRYL